MKLNEEDIKKIEAFLEHENIQTIEYFLAAVKRLRDFSANAYEQLQDLDRKGDLE